MQNIQAIARLPDCDKRKESKEARNRIPASQPQYRQRKQRHHQPVVHHHVREQLSEVQHGVDTRHPQRAEQQPLARRPRDQRIQIRQHNPEQEGRDMRRWRKLQRSHPERVSVPPRMRVSIRMQPHVEPWQHHPQAPQAEENSHQRPRSLRPLPQNHQGEDQIEERLGAHGPGRRVPEGRQRRAPALQQHRRQHNAPGKLRVAAGMPFLHQHAQRNYQREQIDWIQPGHACDPETARAQLALLRPV